MADITPVKKVAINRPDPIFLKDEDTGEEYILEFSRDSIKHAERTGFDIEGIQKYPVTHLPLLFFYAFRMHQKHMTQRQTDQILDDMGGLSQAALERLLQLYNAPMAGLIAEDDGETKNSKISVTL